MSTRPPPPGAPNRFGFNRVYRTNLRPVVIGVGAITALWSLFSISFDKREDVPKLATFAIVLGAIYMALTLIESFGVLAATLQRASLVGAYAYATFLGILLAVGASVLRIVIHFTSKGDILKVCTDITTGARFAVYPYGWWGPSRHETLDATDAANWCNREYNRDSWQLIISLLITMVIWGFFSALGWAYYRQVLDPTSVVNSLRAPSNQFNGQFNGAYPSHYNPPYNPSVPNLGYAAPYANPNPVYAPPAGPPPPRDGPKPAEYAVTQPHTERDVTSRPGPGGRETFQ
ncbi:DBR1 domain-containing protein [Mycena indigotica]|uniref:DBR1 domain-containing protein n=1 Tax=Mycena indigotica TaxID=2126181 RepID=A0A8H6WF00_9AGAR|nr:DBR1 domain-containing protein [Mycena indigotica]KAF7316244.1 DBR1 domain-containing protein [Mycena indigotica]